MRFQHVIIVTRSVILNSAASPEDFETQLLSLRVCTECRSRLNWEGGVAHLLALGWLIFERYRPNMT
nr:hypothetical protein [Pseudomonas syringae pv. actinidiae]